jgi:hypothetical protein
MNGLCVEAPFCAIVPITMATEPLPEATAQKRLALCILDSDVIAMVIKNSFYFPIFHLYCHW